MTNSELLLQTVQRLESAIEQIENDVDEQVQHNLDQFNMQIDRIVEMLKWVILLLVPPMLLNVFSDLRRMKSRVSEAPRKPDKDNSS